MARQAIWLWLDVHSRAMHGQRGTAILMMLQGGVVDELNCRFNARVFDEAARQRTGMGSCAPGLILCVEGGQTATTSREPLTEGLDGNGRGQKIKIKKEYTRFLSTRVPGGLRSR